MNASEILIALMDIKQFYGMISKRATLQKLTSNAFAENGTAQSRTESLVLLTRFVQIYKEKQMNAQNHDDSDENNVNGDDDEIIINEGSDEDKDNAKEKADTVLVEILCSTIPYMKKALIETQCAPVMSSLNLTEIKPFGLTRLRVLELLAALVKMNKHQVSEAIQEQSMLTVLVELIVRHPWNNFLQLKTQQIFEDLLESEALSKEEKFTLLKTSGVVGKLITMSETPKVTFISEKQMRHGYMGFAIKLSNLIKKKFEAEQMSTVEGSDDVFNSEWTHYVEGELTRSNNENARNLGGRPHSNDTEEEETNQFDVNMDRIMQRFNCFNSIMQNSTSEDDKNDDITEEPDAERPTSPKIEVELPVQEAVDPAYNVSYWKVEELTTDEELAALMAEME